jgi:hypothetical protein
MFASAQTQQLPAKACGTVLLRCMHLEGCTGQHMQCYPHHAGAYINRKQPTPATPSELYEPAAGSKGALPYTMEYTPRMK